MILNITKDFKKYLINYYNIIIFNYFHFFPSNLLLFHSSKIIKAVCKSLNKIRDKKEFADLKRKYWAKTKGAQWLARGNYVTEFKRDSKKFKEEIEPYTQELFKHINNREWDSASIEMSAKSPEEAYLNKTHAGEVAVAVDDITKQIMRDLTVENLFNLAASQGFGAGVSQSQLETRMKMEKQMSKKLNEEFKGLEVDNSKKLWTSCFYLVIK